MFLYVGLCEYGPHVCRCLQETEGVGSPGVGYRRLQAAGCGRELNPGPLIELQVQNHLSSRNPLGLGGECATFSGSSMRTRAH